MTETTNDAGLVYSGTELDAMSVAVNYHRWIISKFAPYLGSHVAEVGAGIGSVSKLLLEQPIERLSSFEPSQNMFPRLAASLRDEPRAEAINQYFDVRFADRGFDSIIYNNVMEHIEDDRAEISTALATLKPGGHLLIFVPALMWLYSDFDEHLGHFRRYTTRGLSSLASELGFEVVSARYFDIAGILPWFVVCKLLHKRPEGGSLSLYDKLVVPPMRVLEGIVSPPIGKNVMLIARKPA
ncbi:MAG: class I SAM-dependent methyltransferase [Burkholderiales bacterium]